MPCVRVEHEQQRRPTLHDTDAGVLVTMNAAFVALGQSESPLKSQVVDRQVGRVSTGKQTRGKGSHGPSHVLAGGVAVLREARRQRIELDLALGACARRRVQRAVDFAYLPRLPANRVQRLRDGVRAPLDASGELGESAITRPPFFSARARPTESKTSSRASAIRTPGG